jgi:hypothetical protein
MRNLAGAAISGGLVAAGLLLTAPTSNACAPGEEYANDSGVSYACLDGEFQAVGDAAGPVFIPGEGTFLVGIDMPPGTYNSRPSRALPCQWWTLGELGNDESQTGFDSSNGQTYAVVRPTDEAFHTQFCQSWYKIR